METRLNSEPLNVDVLIVGAGPAGSACAARLAAAGRSVALVDRAVPGRERVCGGFLGPEFADWAEAWGWGEDFSRLPKSPVRQVQISGSGSRLVRAGLAAAGFAVDRGVFDRWAADAAVRRGAVLWTGATAEDLGRAEGIWEARIRPNGGGGDRRVRAKHWVNATGRRPAPAGKTEVFFASKAVFRGVEGLADTVALHFVERGHVGLNPIGPDEATLCLCVDSRYLRESKGSVDGMMRVFEAVNPSLKAQLKNARRVSEWKNCQAEPDGRPIFYQDQKFYIGDALSMVNPVIGGGIPIAMQSGVMLADLMAGEKFELQIAADFERSWREAFSKKFRFGGWLGVAERSAFASRFVMGAIGAAPALLPGLVRMSRPVPAR